MSATGILKAECVVFYHPLDDFTERTQGQAWTGSGGFVPGKIGLANSAVSTGSAAWGAVQPITGGCECDPGRGAVIGIDPSTAVLTYCINATGVHVMGRVATVSGSDVALGPAYHSGGHVASRSPGGAHFGGGRFVVAYRDAYNKLSIQVGQVSGTAIDWGPVNATGPATSQASGGIAALTASAGVVTYSTYSPAYHVWARVLQVSGLDATVGAATQISAIAGATGSDITPLDGTRAVVAWGEGDGTRSDTAVLTVSGSIVAAGAAATFFSGDLIAFGAVSVIALDSGKVAYTYVMASAPRTIKTRVAAVSGDSFGFGAEQQVVASGYYGGSGRLAAAQYVVCWTIPAGQGFSRAAAVCTVSGLSVAVGGASTTSAGAHRGATEALSETSFLHMADGGSVAAGAVGQEAQIAAPTPGAYPAATGQGHVAVAMWAKNLTKGSSVVTVRRDYEVTLTATSITLGPASAVWSGAGIGSLMSTMNDGHMNLLVLDFVHTGGGAWTLSASLNGGAWAGHGAGTGTRTTSPASAAPKLQIQGGESGQWVDELVVWAGDFQTFTTEELANLHDLADVFRDPMDQYEEDYGAPICWQATARMPDGSVWRDSGSGPCPPVVRVPRGASDVVVTDDGAAASPRIVEG